MAIWFNRKKSTKNKYIISHENESMDCILQGLLESQQPDGVKLAIIDRICDEGAKSSQPAATVKGVLQLSCKWILYGSSELQWSSGFKLFHQWGKHNPEQFASYFSPQLVGLMLAGGQSMEANVPLLLREGFRVLSLTTPSVYDEHASKIQEGITKFICQSAERNSVRNCILLFGEVNECIPATSEGILQLCKVILHSLARGIPPQTGKEMVDYIKQTEEIATFLSRLWRLRYANLVQDCLVEIFHVISQRELGLDHEPTICLASVVKHIDPALASQVVQEIVSDPSIPDKAIELAIGHLVDWLKWPTAPSVALWLTCIFTELAAAGKYILLTRITNTNIEQVVENIVYPQIRMPSFQILSQLLLSYQHEPGPFHKFLEKFPVLWKTLGAAHTQDSQNWCKELSSLVYCMMYLFTGFPEVYDPILDLIKLYPKPKEEEMRLELKRSHWSNQQSYPSSRTSQIGVGTLPETVYPSPLHVEKLEPGKTGLDNLGNTCYMNSIIQALYMCDQFRREVLSKPPTNKESLLVKLQYIFASLSLSNRPSISPSKFMAASRPPWFMPGHQQDCSEFLKYLMDQLHENDRSGQLSNSHSSNSLSSQVSARAANGQINGIPDLKDGVYLTGVKIKSQDDGSSIDSSVSLSEKDSDSPSSFVEKILRGKVQTNIQCLNCKTQSKRIETFSDIPLAFPNSAASKTCSNFSQQQSLVGGSGDPSPNFTDPSSKPVVDSITGENGSCLSLNDLIAFYLKPERMSEDNQYYCDKCGKLQDGERQICIVESPQYLILTLLRFSYDTKKQSRTKILQEVHYPKTLSIPVIGGAHHPKTMFRESSVCSGHGQHHSRSNSLTSVVSLKDPSHEAKVDKIMAMANTRHQDQLTSPSDYTDLYGLSAVVVHSGNSSDCGHYYCYARHSFMGQPDLTQMDKMDLDSLDKDVLDDLDLLPDQWYNFNDGRITKTSYDSFSNLTKRFSSDTAYVLIYRKLDLMGQSQTADPPLRADLRESIMKDNEKYIHEQEIEAKAREEKRRRSSSIASESLKNWRNDRDDDAEGGGGHCGGPFGGGGGMDSIGPRFVF